MVSLVLFAAILPTDGELPRNAVYPLRTWHGLDLQTRRELPKR